MDYGKHMEKRLEARVRNGAMKGFKIFFMIVCIILFFFLAGYVFQLLWNWLMPFLFALPTVSYWQAVGILILAKLIFGFGTGGGSGSGSGKGAGKHRKRSRREFCGPGRGDGKNKWWYYDQFWKEEGASAFEAYIGRHKQAGENPTDTDSSSGD